MQIKVTATAGARSGIISSGLNASNKLEISNCIITFVSSGTTAARGISEVDADTIQDIWNCIIYGLTGGSGVNRGIDLVGTTANIYNCTLYDCGNVGIRENGVGTYTIKNCAVFNNTDDFNGTMTIDYCASDDGDGTNAVTPADWSTVFVDYTNGDFHLKSTDTDLIGAGVDDPGSGLYSDDIDGETRTSTWDIGADEYVVTAVTKTITDTGTGTDAVAQILASLSVSDTGTGTDSIPGIAASVEVSDVGSGTDALAQVLAAITVNDTGTGTDTSPVDGGEGVLVYVPVADTGTGTDAIGAISAALTVTDTGTGTDYIILIGKAKIVVVSFAAKTPSVSFTMKKPSVTFVLKKPSVTFEMLN